SDLCSHWAAVACPESLAARCCERYSLLHSLDARLAGRHRLRRNAFSAANRLRQLRRPHIYREASRVVQNGLLIRYLNSQRRRQIVSLNLCLGIFQRRSHRVDIRSQRKPRVIAREKTVAFGEEVFQRSAANFRQPSRRSQTAVARAKNRGLRNKTPTAVKRELALGPLIQSHLRPVAWLAKNQPDRR